VTTARGSRGLFWSMYYCHESRFFLPASRPVVGLLCSARSLVRSGSFSTAAISPVPLTTHLVREDVLLRRIRLEPTGPLGDQLLVRQRRVVVRSRTIADASPSGISVDRTRTPAHCGAWRARQISGAAQRTLAAIRHGVTEARTRTGCSARGGRPLRAGALPLDADRDLEVHELQIPDRRWCAQHGRHCPCQPDV
jgi:hypothetical protein